MLRVSVRVLRRGRGWHRLVVPLASVALVITGFAGLTGRQPAGATTPTAPPSWWSGDCDATWWNAQAAAQGWHGAGAHPLGASYLGIEVCGPRPGADHAPDVFWKRSGWGEEEFECVELAMRFMAERYGVSAYGANGDGVVRNYSTADGGNLVKVANGTAGHAPQPGDVISFDSPAVGHVGVVASSNVDGSGNGSITMLSQNDTTDGWRTLNVSHWVVASFGDQVPYGWLHDPAGRGGSAGASHAGYWMLEAGGAVHAFGAAINYGSATSSTVAMAPRRDGSGYWLVDQRGDVSGFGAATSLGSAPALDGSEIVTTIAATPSGNGYWLFTDRGRAFAYGDATLHGDMSGVPLNGPVVASVATPTGNGYYMVGSDGGIFSFGDAVFHGSMGGVALNRPVVGIAPTPDNKGYWLVASDGGVFAFGDAPFRGSMGGTTLNQPVNGLVAYGNGYLMVASDGGVFDFSNQPFAGSLGGSPPPTPVVGIAISGP